MSKKKSLIDTISSLLDGVVELENQGVDVNRIIRSVRSKGDSTRTFKEILSKSLELGGSHESLEVAMDSVLNPPLLPEPRPRKKGGKTVGFW